MHPSAINRYVWALLIILTAVSAVGFAFATLELDKPPRALVEIFGTPTLAPTQVLPTLAPPGTSTPRPIAPTPQLKYADSFRVANTSAWPISDSVSVTMNITSSAFVWTLNRTEAIELLGPAFKIAGDNYSIQVDARTDIRTRGVEYGIVFWHGINPRNGNQHVLVFAASNTGSYRLRAQFQNDPALFDLVPQTFNSSIAYGTSANRLRVDSHGTRITLFANGEVLADLDNTALAPFRPPNEWDGRVGLYAAAPALSSVQVRFSNFRLYAP